MAGRHHRVDHLAGYLACRGRQPAIAQTESENRPPGSCDKTRSRAFGCHAVTSNSPEQRTVAAEGEALRMLRYTGPNGHARTRIPPIIRLSMDASRPTNHAHPTSTTRPAVIPRLTGNDSHRDGRPLGRAPRAHPGRARRVLRVGGCCGSDRLRDSTAASSSCGAPLGVRTHRLPAHGQGSH
jgi:hypothetical protein